MAWRWRRKASAEPAEPVESEIAPEVEEIPEAGRRKLTDSKFARTLKVAFGGTTDHEVWQSLEEALLLADVGVATTEQILAASRGHKPKSPSEIQSALRSEMLWALDPTIDREISASESGPTVIMVVGVNGTGKTTTVGKLAHKFTGAGHKVVLGAADTFRAAAADQLQTWAERTGAEFVRGREQGDPAAVAFDAVAKGVAMSADVVLLDTAGRLHTKTGLMDELSKLRRVVEKQAQVDEVLLVLDATTGQNGLTQAKVFSEAVAVTGIVLTKLDGSAKGGVVFAVQAALGVPVKFIGLGETAEDLVAFDPAQFVDALLG